MGCVPRPLHTAATAALSSSGGLSRCFSDRFHVCPMKPRKLTNGVESGGSQGEPSALSLLGTCSPANGRCHSQCEVAGPSQ